nr:MAG TPA: hypothetical protein [Caudoviricetes sp.]
MLYCLRCIRNITVTQIFSCPLFSTTILYHKRETLSSLSGILEKFLATI